VTKLDAQGNFIWAKSFGTTGADEGMRIVVDRDGNVCVAGYIMNGRSGIILKLTSSGETVWTRTFEGTEPGVAVWFG